MAKSDNYNIFPEFYYENVYLFLGRYNRKKKKKDLFQDGKKTFLRFNRLSLSLVRLPSIIVHECHSLYYNIVINVDQCFMKFESIH